MPFDPVSASVRPALDLLKAGIRAIRRLRGKNKAKEITSSVIKELLQESPDVTAAEAQLAALEATGVQPTIEFHRAKQMLSAVRRPKFSAPKKTAKKRWAQVGAHKKIRGKKVSKIKTKGRAKTRSRVKRR